MAEPWYRTSRSPSRRQRTAGRTYAFELRPDIAYSDGRIVVASDFRRAIERGFRIGGPASTFFGGLVGGQACVEAPESCDLSEGIVTDDASGTVTFHWSSPIRSSFSSWPFPLLSRCRRRPRTPCRLTRGSQGPGPTGSRPQRPMKSWSWFATRASGSGRSRRSRMGTSTGSSGRSVERLRINVEAVANDEADYVADESARGAAWKT